MARPCPFVSCHFHLGVVVEGDKVVVMFPDEHGDLDLAAMSDTCVLDVADRARDRLHVAGAEPLSHAEVGRALGTSAGAVKKIELQIQRERAPALRAFFEDEWGSFDLSRLTDTGHSNLDYE